MEKEKKRKKRRKIKKWEHQYKYICEKGENYGR